MHIVHAGLGLTMGRIPLSVGGYVIARIGHNHSVEVIVTDHLNPDVTAIGKVYRESRDMMVAVRTAGLQAGFSDSVPADHYVVDVFPRSRIEKVLETLIDLRCAACPRRYIPGLAECRRESDGEKCEDTK